MLQIIWFAEGIIWTAFCETFGRGDGADMKRRGQNGKLVSILLSCARAFLSAHLDPGQPSNWQCRRPVLPLCAVAQQLPALCRASTVERKPKSARARSINQSLFPLTCPPCRALPAAAWTLVRLSWSWSQGGGLSGCWARVAPFTHVPSLIHATVAELGEKITALPRKARCQIPANK